MHIDEDYHRAELWLGENIIGDLNKLNDDYIFTFFASEVSVEMSMGDLVSSMQLAKTRLIELDGE